MTSFFLNGLKGDNIEDLTGFENLLGLLSFIQVISIY